MNRIIRLSTLGLLWMAACWFCSSSQPLAESLAPAVTSTVTSATTIHQEVDFEASPERVYNALMDAKQFSSFTGAAAEIQPEAGGAFYLFERQITGRNVELIRNKRIVQAWRAASWPEGSYSIVRFELKEQGSGTRLVMEQSGFPDDDKESLESGWKSHYWEPLRKYLSR